jgi:hypothetical protein
LFAWLLEIQQLPEDTFNKDCYPKTMAYLQNYHNLFDSAMSTAKVTQVDGFKAIEIIEAPKLPSPATGTPTKDPLNINTGEEVSIYPKGTNPAHRDTGELVVLNSKEAAVKKRTRLGVEIRVHYPRWETRIERAGRQHENGGLAAHGGDEGLGAEHYEERH